MAIDTTQSYNSANNISVNNNKNPTSDNNTNYKNSLDESLKSKVNAAENNNSNNLFLHSNQSNKNVSVISLEDGDSSIASDSDNEENVVRERRDCESNSNTTKVMNKILMNEAQMIEKSEPDTNTKSNIGNIVVHNSSDITFGNKTFYQGPVTIKQFLVDNNVDKERKGNDNLAYAETSDCVVGGSCFKTDNNTEGN